MYFQFREKRQKLEVYFQFKVKIKKVGSLLPINGEIWYDNGNMIIKLMKGE